MTTRASAIFAIGIVAAMVLAGLLLWPQLPPVMATHWNASGAADGYSSKAFALFLLPVISTLIATLLFLLPSIDPIAKNYAAFRKEYDGLILVILAFMALVQGMLLAWNLGARFEMLRVIAPGIGLLFFYIGAIMPQMKRNWFAGIRTPWTLSSDKVWDETHRVGGKLFRAAGVLACLGGAFPGYALQLIFIPIVASALGTTVYSYLVFRKGA